jgi:drug/metabolite transporter (DMT)-like permease
LGSGAIDTTLKYMQDTYVPKEEVSIFSGSLFAIAACFGLIILLIKSIKKRAPFGVKNIIAGIVLGVPNYYSIVFLIKALQTEGFESSTLFTINNVGIVIVSTLVGILLFKEQFSFKNKIGVALAIVGIVIVALA